MENSRRPLATRKILVFHNLARYLVKIGLHPNHISVMSTVFAIFAGVCFYLAGANDQHVFYIALAAIGIQLRLLCNMLDGLMAVEGGLKTATGEIYNDVPDRISDVVIIIGFAYGAQSGLAVLLGWMAALGAVMTAYIRVLGASMGAGHFFAGPMAKQHRMFFLTLSAVIWAIENSVYQSNYTVFAALLIITLGTAVTCARRLIMISKKLN